MSRQINLYNPALRRSRQLLTLTTVALAALALSSVLVAVGGAMRWRAAALADDLRGVDARMVAATARLGQLAGQATNSSSRDLETLQRLLVERREVLVALRDGVGVDAAGVGFADYLRGLARQTVAGLWLTGFSVARGGAEMEIRGRMLAAGSLPDYIRRLNAEPGFHGRQFLSLSVAGAALGAAATTPAAAPSRTHNSFVLTAVVPLAAGREKELAR